MFFGGAGHYERKFEVEGDVTSNHCWYQKTRMFLLPHSEDRMILCSFVWVQYQRVTDGQTDGRNCHSYYSVLHCKQCGRAVKTDIKLLSCVEWHESGSSVEHIAMIQGIIIIT